MSNPNRIRIADFSYSTYIGATNTTAQAASEIIENPELHLLSQKQLNQAEGGVVGNIIQLGAVAGGLALLQLRNPAIIKYLTRGQLRPKEWLLLGGVSYASYKLGYLGGMRLAGDAQKVRNHWMAYYFVKEQNRFEGR